MADVERLIEQSHPSLDLATDERIVVYAGGVPLYADGRLVGGLGASGGTAAEDEACATAAALAAALSVTG
jgi:uncharacterized protein GlcG (DUF336 family)